MYFTISVSTFPIRSTTFVSESVLLIHRTSQDVQTSEVDVELAPVNLVPWKFVFS